MAIKYLLDDHIPLSYRRQILRHYPHLRLNRFFRASGELMQVLARACGHNHLNQFCLDDLTTWKRDMAYLCGLNYAGVTSL
jgi:hypothetical protein